MMDQLQLPAMLVERWQGRPGGARWLDGLPSAVEACCSQWQLSPGLSFEGSNVALVLAVTRLDGGEAVLKLNFPDVESEREAQALFFWEGHGAVRLIAANEDSHALLMERCRPGRELRSLEDDAAAMAITADVLRRLWRPAPAGHPFRLLAAMAQEWAATLPRQYEAAGAPYERSLVDEVVEALPALAATQGPAVVLHQDLHGGNILQAQREEWLAIDPKPLVGEREFDLASVLRDRWDELAVHDSQALVQRRFDYLCEVLQMDRQRVRLWGMAHALAWGFSGGGTYEALFNAARLIKGCR